MNTQVQVFNHEKFGSIRISTVNGKQWFCLSDVCKALGLSIPARVKSRLEKRGITTMNTPTYNQHGAEILQSMNFIDEPNLYRCIFQSRKEEAEKFQAWVFDEVLPQIRKTGGYIPVTKEDDEKTILCKALAITQRTISERNLEIEQQEKYIQYLEPLAEYTQDVLESPRCYTMTDIAKFEGTTVQSLTRILKERHIIWRRCKHDPFKLFAEHHDKGYEAYRTKTGKDIFGTVLYTNTYLVWTERGRKFIHELLLS